MTLLLSILLPILLITALVFALANYWANTPHGRIKPTFAFVFKLAPILNPSAKGRAIGAARMDTPAQIAKARAAFSKNTAGLSKPIEFNGKIENRTLPGSPGGELPVRIFTPAGEGTHPLVVYLHGGGFVVGDPDYTDVVTRILAMHTPAVVVSVDYRLAPEHRLPAAVEDCEFALNWCYENAESLGARTGPVTIAGDSAGGNLSAVVAQRDHAIGNHRVGLQVLIYPMVDASRMDRTSQLAFAEGYGLSLKDIEDCMRYYVPAGVDFAHPDLSPLHAKSLEGLPKAYVVTAGFDVLRDEGIEYAEALKSAGVDVEHVNEATMPHGFITMTRLCSEAQARIDAIAAEVRKVS